jgi:selenocysteine lyase/cysteine desulfurase
VTFKVSGADPQALWKALLARNAVCSPRLGGIRLSPHFYNVSGEIERFFEIVKEEVKSEGGATGTSGK